MTVSVAPGGEVVTLASLAATARTWWSDEPALLRREQDAMARTAPDLVWSGQGSGSWTGLIPAWPFDRAAPPALKTFMAGRRLRLQLTYGHAFPIIPPAVWSLDPEPSIEHRTEHAWHVNGDGSLCLLETTAAWTGRDPAAELIVKAAGWFIEYLLMSAGLITQMTSTGLSSDVSLDGVIGTALRPGVSPADGHVADRGQTEQQAKQGGAEDTQ